MTGLLLLPGSLACFLLLDSHTSVCLLVLAVFSWLPPKVAFFVVFAILVEGDIGGVSLVACYICFADKLVDAVPKSEYPELWKWKEKVEGGEEKRVGKSV